MKEKALSNPLLDLVQETSSDDLDTFIETEKLT